MTILLFLTLVFLSDSDYLDDKEKRMKDKWDNYLRQSYCKTVIEPIDLFYPRSMPICGCMNSPKDTMVDGLKKYARLLIRFRQKQD